MAQFATARLHRASLYDGSNGAAVVAEIPGASLASGGTGNTTLVIDITDAGQHTIQPGNHIVWTEYPSTPVQVLDTALDIAEMAEVYGGLPPLAWVDQTDAAIAALESEVEGLAGGAQLIQRGTAITDSSGDATITWPATFSQAPVVALGLETSNTAPHMVRITDNTATAVSVKVLRAPVVTVLSINVLGATIEPSGVTVHAIGAAPA